MAGGGRHLAGDMLGDMTNDVSSDSEDRIADFLARHGGAGKAARDETQGSENRGRSEVYAADGYTLRCDWSRLGTRNEMAFSEIPPDESR
jgi:hypothetical protein